MHMTIIELPCALSSLGQAGLFVCGSLEEEEWRTLTDCVTTKKRGKEGRGEGRKKATKKVGGASATAASGYGMGIKQPFAAAALISSIHSAVNTEMKVNHRRYLKI